MTTSSGEIAAVEMNSLAVKDSVLSQDEDLELVDWLEVGKESSEE